MTAHLLRFRNYFLLISSNLDKHEVFVMSAALAYATALALAPFVLIILSLVSVLDPSLQDKLSTELTSSLGDEAGATVQSIIENVQDHPQLSGLSSLLGLIVLAVSASAIFSQLRIALDKINEFKGSGEGRNFWSYLQDKFLSLGLVLGFAFLSIVSLLVTALIAVVYPNAEGDIWNLLSTIVNFFLFAGLFTAIYRFVPTLRLSWRRCFISASVSTLFYLVGKGLISLYLAKAGLGSSYGAAGSLIVFLAWVYYTALTLLLSYEVSTNLILSRK